jgi:hypothetical protein
MEPSKVLIDRLEVLAQKDPARYRLRVAALAALGYAYLLFIVLLLIAFVYGFVYLLVAAHEFNFLALKIAWIPLLLAGAVLRSMWVTIPEPEGSELKYKQAPRLFDLVKDVRKSLSGPHVHHILISDDPSYQELSDSARLTW